jgi:SAM-dependent methyltransferase
MVKRITRCGPVHFQSLEDELAPIMTYFRGSMLNAGCGDRDMKDWLLASGVSELINYDIASSIPDAIIGALEDMPFPEDRFDTILCNAVLEHVEHIDEVMSELARVLAPGGHAVLAVPFLQPYHQCPSDFRRYTAEGLAVIGEKVGLSTVAVKPVHSAAQTLGWIAWEIAKEKGALWRSLCWPWIFLWTRWSLKTDPRITRNANTYQLVFSKP